MEEANDVVVASAAANMQSALTTLDDATTGPLAAATRAGGGAPLPPSAFASNRKCANTSALSLSSMVAAGIVHTSALCLPSSPSSSRARGVT